jgi:hypothetical protein
MKKPFPGQQKCLFMPLKWERILKNPLGKTIFPVNLNGYSQAHRILHFKPPSANETVLGDGNTQSLYLRGFRWVPLSARLHQW